MDASTTTHAEAAKAAFLDYLYARAGRTNGLYTGLWQEFQREASEAARSIWATTGSLPFT